MRASTWMVVMLGAVAMAACSPSLDWRQVRPAGSTLEAMFPCKPLSRARRLPLGGVPTEMTLFACSAGDSTYAVAFADVQDPSRVAPALQELQRAALANVQGEALRREPVLVPGMTPNRQAERLTVGGALPDGQPVHQETAFFVHATRVYQASIVGPRAPEADAVEAFFSGLRLSQ